MGTSGSSRHGVATGSVAGAVVSLRNRDQIECCTALLVSTRQQATFLLVSIVIFGLLTSIGLLVSKMSSDAHDQAWQKEVRALARETSHDILRTLETAMLPLFSMAQLVTHIPIFAYLPEIIGAAKPTHSFLCDGHGREVLYRNVTGICDDPDLLKQFNEITDQLKADFGIKALLSNIIIAPYSVICGTRGTLNLERFVGVDALNSPQSARKIERTMTRTGLDLSGPSTVADVCPSCGLYADARLPVISDRYQVEIQGQTYNRWGFVMAYFDWDEILRQSQAIARFDNLDLEMQLSQIDRLYDNKGATVEHVSVLAETVGYGSKRKEVKEKIVTSNAQWRQVNAALRGSSIEREARLEVEKSVTAYFAHELRNPLGAIDCALESMPGGLPMEATDLIRGMQLCSSFMSSIMNNLLDVRKIEEGKMVMKADPLSLKLLLEEVRKMTWPSVRPGVELKVLVETEGRDCVLGDSYRLKQILTNLVTNAIKNTTSGSITLYAGWKGDFVRLECRDTGPGIPQSEQRELFERFVMRGRASGSGLGLAIAKQIVDLMHGSIEFNSDPRARPGTDCIVLVPLQPCLNPVSSDIGKLHDRPIDDKFSLLIVDDIPLNRVMLRKRIHKGIAPHCFVSEAATGEEALMMCETEQYHVIIVDQHMEEAGGVMLGTDVIAAMRRSGLKSFIVGCSGDDDMETIFRASGADVVWRKPLPSNDAIVQHLRAGLMKTNSAIEDFSDSNEYTDKT